MVQLDDADAAGRCGPHSTRTHISIVLRARNEKAQCELKVNSDQLVRKNNI